MSIIMINNLIFCIEKLSCGGHSVHEKNNRLMKLDMLRKNSCETRFKRITDNAIKFIIKESKKVEENET